MIDDDSGVHIYGEVEAAMDCDTFGAALMGEGLKVEAGDYSVRVWVRGEPHEFELIDGGFAYGAGPGDADFIADIKDIARVMKALDLTYQFQMFDGDTGKRVERISHAWPLDRAKRGIAG